jgi:hypothetical protein
MHGSWTLVESSLCIVRRSSCVVHLLIVIALSKTTRVVRVNWLHKAYRVGCGPSSDDSLPHGISMSCGGPCVHLVHNYLTARCLTISGCFLSAKTLNFALNSIHIKMVLTSGRGIRSIRYVKLPICIVLVNKVIRSRKTELLLILSSTHQSGLVDSCSIHRLWSFGYNPDCL